MREEKQKKSEATALEKDKEIQRRGTRMKKELKAYKYKGYFMRSRAKKKCQFVLAVQY